MGINIDADEKSIKEFKNFRKKDYNISALISSKKDKIKYYFYHERSALNTKDANLVKKEKQNQKRLLQEKQQL